MLDTKILLSKQARKLNSEYAVYISEVKDKTKQLFGDLTGKNGKLTARYKSVGSILAKLTSKQKDGELILSDNIDNSCKKAINDAYGTRLQLDTLSENEAKTIVENAGMDFKDFTLNLQNCIDNGDIPDAATIEVLETLKEKQTQPVLDRLIEQSHNPEFKITEINNYGDEISSYFTYEQVKKLAYALNNPDFYMITKTKPEENYNTNLAIDNETNEVSENVEMKNPEGEAVGIVTQKGAVKKSGYSSFQVNVEYLFSDNNNGMGELQIRSTKLNEFAEAEHIPYDIRKGKIKKTDKKYAPIYNLIKGMNKESYNNYNKYLTKVYQSIRMQELGLDVKVPELKGEYTYSDGTKIPEEEMQKLEYANLIKCQKS